MMWLHMIPDIGYVSGVAQGMFLQLFECEPCSGKQRVATFVFVDCDFVSLPGWKPQFLVCGSWNPANLVQRWRQYHARIGLSFTSFTRALHVEGQ